MSDYDSNYDSDSSYKYDSEDEYDELKNISELLDMDINDSKNISKLINKDKDKISSDTIDVGFEFKLINVLEYNVDKDIIQYPWTIYCLKLKKYFGDNCIYDINNNLSISFIYDSKKYTLSVDNHKNKNLWYPYDAPNIEYKEDDKIKLSQYVLITNNKFLIKHEWNICNDLFKFIYECNKILSYEKIYKFNEFDNIIYNLITKLNISFSFYNYNQLPEFGIIKTYNNNGGSSYCAGQKTKFVSVVEDLYINLNKLLKHIHSNDHTKEEFTTYNSDYLKLLTLIFNTIGVDNYFINDNTTELELIMNERVYVVIISIVKKLHIDIDITNLESKLDLLNEVGKCDPKDNFNYEKVSIIESFKDSSKGYSHYFSTKTTPNDNNKFIKRVNAELKNIKESLKDYPIYVIGTEENMHLFKILFVPEYDTPYAGGYYEFDLFLPNGYPHAVPKMHFLTTDNNKFRFNPNLYNCGKVCLSLLNTWAENQWDPDNSTLSQVLISVYSMIFCSHPYTNEPAYYDSLQSAEGRKRSEQYNNNIRYANVNIAIKKQLQNDKTPFKDIIQNHWEQNKEKTLKTISDWNLTF